MRPRGAIEILEEATALLRSAPASTIAVYLLGAVPFSLGLLYFWTDMARNPFAPERLPWESLLLTLLLVWKSGWQARFQAELHGQLSLETTFRPRALSTWLIQGALQPLSMIAIPLSLILTIPFGWTVAFFRNVGLLAALGDPQPVAAARKQALLWQGQNWSILAMISLAAVLTFANVLIAIIILPMAGRSLLGIEGELARLGFKLLNLTTLTVAGCIAWLFIDPLLDAVYVLRCFYGKSLVTGADLRVALKQAAAAAIVLVALATSTPLTAQAPDTQQAPQPVAATLDAGRLHRDIEQVVRRPEFAWRAPKPAGPEPEGRWVGWIRAGLRMVDHGMTWLSDKIGEWFRNRPDEDSTKDAPAQRPPLEILTGLVAVVLLGTLIALFLRRPSKSVLAGRVEPAATSPVDLADESVTADQMPETSWVALAEEWLAKGDCRLAMRALYLAALNHLSTRELITIRKWKSGRDYRSELERRIRARASADPQVAFAFTHSVESFERGWYGRQAVERADVEAFAAGLEEMRRHAGRA